MDVTLKGRVALITGGSQGFGLAMAVRMAAGGADVALLARGADALVAARRAVEETARGRVHIVSCNVAEAAAVEAAYADVIAAFGRVDILVNNAGTARTGVFTSIPDEVWQADLDLKLFAAIRLTRHAWPGMVERRHGRIINVLATLAKAPKAATAPTAVSRAAGMALTKVLAGEGAPHGSTPGQICSAVAMLAEHARGVPSLVTDDLAARRTELTDAEIRERMSGNICRCAAYPNIVAAIRDVAHGLGR